MFKRNPPWPALHQHCFLAFLSFSPGFSQKLMQKTREPTLHQHQSTFLDFVRAINVTACYLCQCEDEILNKISLLIWKMVGTLSSSWLVLCKSISCAQVNGVKIAGKHNENLSWHVETHIWETTLCQSAETEWASAFTSRKTLTKSRELVFYQNKNGKNFPFSIIPQRSKLLSRLFNSCFQTSIEKWPGLPWRDRPRRWRMRSWWWWRRWRMGDVGAEDHGWLNHWLSVLSALICTFSLRLNWVDQLMFVFLVGLRYKEETAVGILSEENDGEHFAL